MRLAAGCNMQSRATRDDCCRPVNPLIYGDRRPPSPLTLRYSHRSPNMARDRPRQTAEDHQRRGCRALASRRLRVHLVLVSQHWRANEFSLASPVEPYTALWEAQSGFYEWSASEIKTPSCMYCPCNVPPRYWVLRIHSEYVTSIVAHCRSSVAGREH